MNKNTTRPIALPSTPSNSNITSNNDSNFVSEFWGGFGTGFLIGAIIAVLAYVYWGPSTPCRYTTKPSLTSTSASTTTNPSTTPPPAKGGVIVPLYVYPSDGSWGEPLTTTMSGYSGVPIILVINPGNGPHFAGTLDQQRADRSNYVPALKKLSFTSNHTWVGYIPTNNGAASASEVVAQMEKWKTFFSTDASGNATNIPPPSGIFLDEVSGSHTSYYTDLATEFRKIYGANGTLILNPGTQVPDTLWNVDSRAIVCNYENYQYINGSTKWTSDPTFVSGSGTQAFKNRDKSRHLLLIHTMRSDSNVQSEVNAALSNNYGWVYFTDDVHGSADNPWDKVSAFLEDTVKNLI